MEDKGLDTSYIRRLGPEHASARTAQYVAVNDAEKSMFTAMADMAILTAHSFPTYWASILKSTRPKWLVVDGNWPPREMHHWISTGGQVGAKVAYEPVSSVKAAGLFAEGHTLPLFPHAALSIATPNQHELAAMYTAAKDNGYLDGLPWFEVIDAFGMHGGARDRFVKLTSADMTDAGLPVQSIQLLPYIPTVITKVGDKGALLTAILGPEDPRLSDPEHERYILSRAPPGHPSIGAVYMRLYPAVERVATPISVNGMGDTFLGTLVAGLALGGRVEDLVDVAQKAAVLTLKSHLSVSPDLGAALGHKLLAACGLDGA
jgi:pseudouridylate synthase / pseudouridine kinase